MKDKDKELPVIQQVYDLIIWYVPVLNRLPRDHKFNIGNRVVEGLYEVLEQLILARFETDKLARLETINARLNVVRYQTRLLADFKQLDGKQLYQGAKLINEVGQQLGQWIKQQKGLLKAQ